MKLFSIFKKKPNVSTLVKKDRYGQVGERWQVRFNIGNQAFNLKGVENKEVAEWYEEMLNKALDKLK